MATNPNNFVYIGGERYYQGTQLTPYQMNWLNGQAVEEFPPVTIPDYVIEQFKKQGGSKAVAQQDAAANPPQSSSTVNQPGGVVTDAASNREFVNNGGGAATGIKRVPVTPAPAPANNEVNDDSKNKGTVRAQAPTPAEVTTPYKGLTNSGAGSEKLDALFPGFNGKPGARKSNPLSYYSSYTYGLTLYMCTPDYYNQFVLNDPPGPLPTGNAPDGRSWDSQLFVIAQSGGVNNSSQNRAFTNDLTGGLRYPPLGNTFGFNEGLDFYIDDLTFETILSNSQVNAASSIFKFKIIEPQGFSFFQKMNVASARLSELSTILSNAGQGRDPTKTGIGGYNPTPLQQIYILGIRFYGYDSAGNIILPTSVPPPFAPLNPPSDSHSITERFFALRMTDITFKLGTGSTVYDCVAGLRPQEVQGLDKGVIKTNTDLSSFGGTVGEALDSLIAKLNDDVRSIYSKITDTAARGSLTEYAWEEVPTSSSGKYGPIGSSSLIDDKNVEKQLTPFAGKLNVEGSNNVANQFTNTVKNIQGRSLSFAAGKQILAAIDDLIVKSDFVTKSLVGVSDGKPEAIATQIKNNKPLQWYSVNTVATTTGFNPVTRNWDYRILYQLRVFDVPYVRSPLVSRSTPFPGVFKYYPYYFTGQNQEVLDFDLSVNNLFKSLVGLTAAELNFNSDLNPPIPISFQGGVNGTVEGGKLNKGSEHNNAVKSHLFNVQDLQIGKLRIMGDPDYLMSIIGLYQQLSGDSNSGANGGNTGGAKSSANAIYGQDFSINPMAGQVFIQIYFKTAEDYNNPGYNGKPNDGLMDVNDQIQFYASGKIQNTLSQNGVDGLIYEIKSIDSTFSKGQFTQILTLSYVVSEKLLNGDQKDPPTSPTVQTEKTDPTVNVTPGTPNANENQTYDEFGTPIPKVRTGNQVAGYQGDLIAADAAASASAAGGATTPPKTEQGNNGDKTTTPGTAPAPQGREATLPYAPTTLNSRRTTI